MRSSKPAIGFIIVTLLLDTLGFGLLIPVSPMLIEHLKGWNEQQAAPYVGLLAACYAAMQFLFAPVLGSLSDHFGRRPVLLISMFGSGLDYFAMALSPTLWILFLTRAINGMSGASFSVANAYIADVTPPEKRAGAYGMVGAAFGIGFMLGPLVGGALGRLDIHYPFYAAGTITLINWLYGFFVLPESLAPENHAPFTFRRANPVAAFAGLGRYPLVASLAASFFFFNVAQFGLHATWVFYTQHRFGWGPVDVGLSLFLVGLGAAIVQAGLARKLIPRFGERNSMLFGFGLGILAFIGYGLATQGWMMYVIIAVGSLGGIGQPAAQSMISRTVRADEQGRTQGALSALMNVANIIGPLIGANIFAYFISDRAPFQLPGAPFFSGAILCMVGWGLAFWAIKRYGGMLKPLPKFQPPNCVQCGYDRTGLAIDASCPECGQAAQA